MLVNEFRILLSNGVAGQIAEELPALPRRIETIR
jgi:hypothetical protein